MKDAEDRKLEALFSSDNIADDGFSARIEKRIRRAMWVRRMTLPVAVLIGGLMSAKALAGLLTVFLKFLSVLPKEVAGNFTSLVNLGSVASAGLPQISTLALAAVVAFGFVMAARILEDA